MSDSIAIALLSFGGTITSTIITLVVCLMNNHYQGKRQKAELENQKDAKLAELKKASDDHVEEMRKATDKQMQDFKTDVSAHFQEVIATNTELSHQIELLNVQMTNLDAKVEKHNHVVDRMYAAESSIKLLDNEIKNLKEEVEKAE